MKKSLVFMMSLCFSLTAHAGFPYWVRHPLNYAGATIHAYACESSLPGACALASAFEETARKVRCEQRVERACTLALPAGSNELVNAAQEVAEDTQEDHSIFETPNSSSDNAFSWITNNKGKSALGATVVVGAAYGMWKWQQ